MPPGDGHDEPQVRLDELTLGVHVATLDAPRQRDLLLGGEQRYLSHLAEVHAHGIGGRGLDGEVELRGRLVFTGGIDLDGVRVAIEDIDAEIGAVSVDLLDLFHAELEIAQRGDDLRLLEVALLSTLIEQCLDFLVEEHASEIGLRGTVVGLGHTASCKGGICGANTIY